MKPVLHPQTTTQLEAFLRHPQGSWLFAVTEARGEGFDTWLASALHGHEEQPDDCERCRRIKLGAHPDVHIVLPGDKGSIGIAAIHEVIHEMGVSRHDQAMPYRLLFVDQAERLTTEAQNAFLKLLEEPPIDCVIVLTTNDPTKLLETIRSRCRMVQVLSAGATEPVAEETVQSLLTGSRFDRLTVAGKVEDVETAKRYAMQLGALLSRQLRTASRDQLSKLVQAQTALERLQLHLESNVTPRAAMSAFVLELR